jgi:hypothetical protein
MKVDKQHRGRKSPWAFAVSAIMLCVLSYYLLGLYGSVHWQIGPRVSIMRVTIDNIITESRTEGSGVQIPDKMMEILEWTQDESDFTTGSLLGHLQLQRLVAGVASLVCAIVAVTRKPRWIGLVAIVFGVIALGFNLIIM